MSKIPSLTKRRPARGRVSAGQALVEFAFVLPILLVLLLGVIEIGRYAYISILIGNAARAGAAFGAASLTNSNNTTGITTAADNDYQSNGQNVSTLTVASTVTCGCDIGGTISSDTNGNCFPGPGGTPPACSGHWVVTVHVTASGSFASMFNYPGIPTPLAISKTASMRAADH